jgi:hypothetical protein
MLALGYFRGNPARNIALSLERASLPLLKRAVEYFPAILRSSLLMDSESGSG